jgi:hypothetical protein
MPTENDELSNNITTKEVLKNISDLQMYTIQAIEKINTPEYSEEIYQAKNDKERREWLSVFFDDIFDKLKEGKDEKDERKGVLSETLYKKFMKDKDTYIKETLEQIKEAPSSISTIIYKSLTKIFKNIGASELAKSFEQYTAPTSINKSLKIALAEIGGDVRNNVMNANPNKYSFTENVQISKQSNQRTI